MLDSLQQWLPQYNLEKLKALSDVHRGPEGGRMDTLGLLRAVKHDEAYLVDGKTLKPAKDLFALDLENEATHPPYIVQPNHLEFEAKWDKTPLKSGEGNNILGDNGGLYINTSILQVPVVKATPETLAYYGAVLIPENSAIRFPNHDPYPIWKMHVGETYVQDFIMSDEGGGFYLEYHNDQPHFHMVVDGGGYYLLAKQITDNTFHITAFELANGQAVYTKKGAIHCDATLTGHLLVGYTASNDVSTVLLRTQEKNDRVQIDFLKV